MYSINETLLIISVITSTLTTVLNPTVVTTPSLVLELSNVVTIEMNLLYDE